MSRRARRAVALGLILGLGLPAAVAVADGDPASDVLLGQSVFLGYGTVSHAAAARLYAVTASAAAHAYPLRVAVIGARSDLGTVPVLFGRPAAYARFLSSEVPGSGPILVVMPAGVGLARGGRGLSTTALDGLGTGTGTPDDLASTAVSAVERLAAAAGHPLPADAATAATSGGASAATIVRALGAIGVMALLAAAGIAAGWRARGRAARLD